MEFWSPEGRYVGFIGKLSQSRIRFGTVLPFLYLQGYVVVSFIAPRRMIEDSGVYISDDFVALSHLPSPA